MPGKNRTCPNTVLETVKPSTTWYATITPQAILLRNEGLWPYKVLPTLLGPKRKKMPIKSLLELSSSRDSDQGIDSRFLVFWMLALRNSQGHEGLSDAPEQGTVPPTLLAPLPPRRRLPPCSWQDLKRFQGSIMRN